jgi:hypothetical protein
MTRLPPPHEQFDILCGLLRDQLLSDRPSEKVVRLYFADMLPIFLADRTVLREGQARFLHQVISDVNATAVDGDEDLFRGLQYAFLNPSTLLP